ncbi:hypothetical protein [Sphingobium sp. CAP-1]|uniref:hypothetical protein n=1 Tax=Sphingobium sp. CAP-1 TaxID=2676077 RepID=UPI0012BB21D5|nr:hypothetical protein [Sphingobium sp. CAP-1]QGP78655.1 hypothetical protein GL174_06385 [Sphingobium sp. CAP-1]
MISVAKQIGLDVEPPDGKIRRGHPAEHWRQAHKPGFRRIFVALAVIMLQHGGSRDSLLA